MKFYKSNLDNFIAVTTKIQRYYAFKYEVPKDQITLMHNDNHIHILIDGKLKESIRPETLLWVGLDEETLVPIKVAVKHSI